MSCLPPSASVSEPSFATLRPAPLGVSGRQHFLNFFRFSARRTRLTAAVLQTLGGILAGAAIGRAALALPAVESPR